MKLKFALRAQKDLKKLDKTTQKQIIKKLDFFIDQPDPLKYAAKLTGFSGGGDYRFRVGRHRIVFDLAKNTIIVLYVEHRREIYRKR
ncbi:MAG: type II toxin-antitoxin system RelE/ParE family toxin [Patescibacteria group bacterium]